MLEFFPGNKRVASMQLIDTGGMNLNVVCAYALNGTASFWSAWRHPGEGTTGGL